MNYLCTGLHTNNACRIIKDKDIVGEGFGVCRDARVRAMQGGIKHLTL